MFELSDILLKSISIYFLVCFGLYKIKHPKMFKPNGEFRAFGLNKEETTTPFWLVSSLIGISTYYLLLVQEGKYMK